MASVIIHIAIAKKVNDILKLNNDEFLLGATAPDMGKLIYGTRLKTHFADEFNEINLKSFLNKYNRKIDTAYELGYYTHLLSDIIWEHEFFPQLFNGEYLKLKNGDVIKTTRQEMKSLIYNDYTNLNKSIIDHYNIDLSFLDKDYSYLENDIEEISIKDINRLVHEIKLICTKNADDKLYVFDLEPLIKYIDDSALRISNKLYNRY